MTGPHAACVAVARRPASFRRDVAERGRRIHYVAAYAPAARHRNSFRLRRSPTENEYAKRKTHENARRRSERVINRACGYARVERDKTNDRKRARARCRPALVNVTTRRRGRYSHRSIMLYLNADLFTLVCRTSIAREADYSRKRKKTGRHASHHGVFFASRTR